MSVRKAAPKTLKRIGRRAYVRMGAATAGLRLRPDFIVIGAQRCGTTSLFRALMAHPQVTRPAFHKGINYFDLNYHRGFRWYQGHFPLARIAERKAACFGGPVAFEASGYYLYHPFALERLARDLPHVKLVVMLRDPVERAFSHYKERRSNGTEPLTLAEAVDAEPVRLAGEAARIVSEPGYVSFAHRHQSYVDQGRYAPMLERWFAAFGRDRVQVEVSEEMYASPQPVVDRVTARLGLPARALEHPEPYNAEPDEGFDPEVRARLRELLAPDVAAVEQLLGRSLPWSTD